MDPRGICYKEIRNYPHAAIVFKYLAFYVLRLLPNQLWVSQLRGPFQPQKGPRPQRAVKDRYSHSHQLRVVVNTVDRRSPANDLGCIKPCKYRDRLLAIVLEP